MRSQKQTNKAPRPFKLGGSERGWAGGNRNDANLLPKKPLVRLVKPTPPPAVETPNQGEVGSA